MLNVVQSLVLRDEQGPLFKSLMGNKQQKIEDRWSVSLKTCKNGTVPNPFCEQICLLFQSYFIYKNIIKLLLFADEMKVYIENLKDPIKTSKLLEIINEFSKLAGYKINTQKSVMFP